MSATNKQPKEKKIIYLDADPIIESQKYICISFLSPKNVKNFKAIKGCEDGALKFRGAFPTFEEAKDHAKELQEKLDPDFHIFVGEGFKWIPMNPDPETLEDQEYYEKELNELMKAQKENILQQKKMEADRKKDMIEDAMKNGTGKVYEGEHPHDTKDNKTKRRLQKKALEKQGDIKGMDEEDDEPEVDLATVKKEMQNVVKDEKKIESDKLELQEMNEKRRKLVEACKKYKEKTKESDKK